MVTQTDVCQAPCPGAASARGRRAAGEERPLGLEAPLAREGLRAGLRRVPGSSFCLPLPAGEPSAQGGPASRAAAPGRFLVASS